MVSAATGKELKSGLLIRLLKVESYSRGIVLSSTFNLLAKGLAFGTSLAIAYYFGLQSATDMYFYALGAVTMLAALFSGLNSAVIIPEAMRIDIREGGAASMAFLNFFLFMYLGIGVLVTAAFAYDPLEAYLTLSRFSPEKLGEHLSLLVATVPLFGLILVSTFLSDILISRKYFTIPMVTSMINSGLVLVSAFWFHERLGVMSLVAGLLVAYVLQIALLLSLMITALDWKFLSAHVRISRLVATNLLYAGGGTAMSVLSSYTPLVLFSGMSAGVITALSYGQRLADLPSALITLQFSSVAAIKFNELCAKHDEGQLNEVFVRSGEILLFVLIPISALVYVFSDEIVEVLYHRGAFDAHAVKSSAMFLRYLILLLPLIALNTLVSRVFMAAQRMTVAFWYQAVGNGVLILLVVCGVHFLGVEGYPLGMIATYAINAAAYVVLLRAIFPFLGYGRVLRTLGILVIVNGVLTCLLLLAKPILLSWGILGGMGGAAIFYMGVLLALNAVWRMNEEVHHLLAGVGRLFERRSS
jgi:putative peptidoglycan lipid II flippase